MTKKRRGIIDDDTHNEMADKLQNKVETNIPKSPTEETEQIEEKKILMDVSKNSKTDKKENKSKPSVLAEKGEESKNLKIKESIHKRMRIVVANSEGSLTDWYESALLKELERAEKRLGIIN